VDGNTATHSRTGDRWSLGNPRRDRVPFVERIRGAFPDINTRIEDDFGAKDKVVVRWSATMTHKGDKSRGYCLEMICADFLAGANLDNGNRHALALGLPVL
jgi:hypothetical protein